MEGLTWLEISIAFHEPEAVRVKARGKAATFTYDAMGFKHRKSREAKPNQCWSLFRGLAMVSTSDKTWSEVCCTSNLKRGMARLRDHLQLFFRIHADPIVFKKGGYQPAFILTIEDHVTGRCASSTPAVLVRTKVRTKVARTGNGRWKRCPALGHGDTALGHGVRTPCLIPAPSCAVASLT
jgi:hypothetical protein